MSSRQFVMSILSTLISQDTEIIYNFLRPDLLLILSIMFAFIAVIVKRETRPPLPLTGLEKFKVQSLVPGQS